MRHLYEITPFAESFGPGNDTSGARHVRKLFNSSASTKELLFLLKLQLSLVVDGAHLERVKPPLQLAFHDAHEQTDAFFFHTWLLLHWLRRAE